MSGSGRNRVNRNIGISSFKRVTRKLKEVARFIRAKQRQRKVQKSVQITRFYIFFEYIFSLLYVL